MKRNLLFLCMVLAISIPCLAEEFSATNSDGVSINYEITSDSTVSVIRGSSNTGRVVIPDSVEYKEKLYAVFTIGNMAFYNYDIKSIEIPNTVISIGSRAFENCAALDTVLIGNSVKTISLQAFYNCPKLSYITLGESVDSIGDNAFLECKKIQTVNVRKLETLFNLKCGNYHGNPFNFASTLHLNGEEVTKLVLPEGITEINSGFFYNFGKNITSVTLPNSLKTINGATFLDWSKLEHLTLGDSLTSIGNCAFNNCTSLSYISFGDSIRNFGAGAFNGCDSLTINVTKLETLFNNFSFGGNNSNPFEKATQLCVNDEPITELIVPNTIKEIKSGVFNGRNITALKVSDSVEKIGSNAFSNCKELASIDLGQSVDTIFAEAFRYCSNIESIAIPNSVKVIDDRAFEGCTKLSSITLNDSLETIGEQAFQSCTSLTSIVIPNSIKELPNEAFRDCSSLSSVVYGDSLRTIGQYAFRDCKSLESITFPNSLVSIGHGAFEECIKLSYITLGDSVKTIADYAFYHCDSLNTVNIYHLETMLNIQCGYNNSNPFSIASTLHLNGAELTELVIPEGITEIKSGFLYNFGKNVTSITLPNSLVTVKDYTFQDWSKLEHLTLGDSIRNFGYAAFHGCDSLTINVAKLETLFNDFSFGGNNSNPFEKAVQLCLNDQPITELDVPNTVKEIKGGVFNGRNITTLKVSNSVEKIGDNAFSNCKDLISVDLGQSVDTIFAEAFRYCSNIESIVIPNSVTAIGYRAFEGCTKLSSITLGDSVTFIGSNAFNGCDSLQRVEVTNMDTWYAIQFENEKANPLTIAQHLYHNGEEVTGLHIPDGIAEINEGFFKGYENITSVVLPNSVKRIGDRAFRNLTKLKSVILGDSLISIGNNAFSNCKDLTSVDLGQSVDTIFAEAFRYCSNIDSIAIPNSVKFIDDRAFEGCTRLSTITLGDSVTFIGRDAFNGCDSLQRVEVTNMDTWYAIQFENEKANPLTIAQHLYHNGEEVTGLHIPDGIAEINEGFFKGYENITSVVLPNSVKRIGDRAFRNLTNLKSVTLGDSLTTIGSLAFDNCISLSYISFGDSIRNFGNGAFQGCDSLAINVTKLETLFNNFSFGGNNSNPFEKATQLCVNDEPITELIVPNTINEIKGGVFNGKNITALKVSDSVEKIGTNAFSNCKELASIDLGQSVDTIFAEAFRYCSNIDSIAIPNSVKVIDDRAFEGCTKLSSITLGDSVTFIGSNAFNGCDSLQRVEVTNLDAWYAIQFENDKANPLTLAQHLYHNGEEVTGFHIPDGIAEINEGFFKGYENITSVVLPNSVRRIGYRAFKNLTNLKSVILGDSLKTIGREAFQGCTALESIIIPNSVTTIDGGVFEGCTKLSSITLGDSVKSIGHYAFNGCDKLSKVNVTNMANFCNIEFARHNSNGGNSNPLLIAKHLYLNDEKVTDLVIPNEVERIANYVFAGSDIISVSIPNSVHVIGDYAFRDCSSLTSVVIGDSVTTIGADAFWGCHELSYISLGESLDSIANSAFFACDSLIVNVTKIETLFKDYKFGSWSSNPFSCSIELCLNDEPIVELEVPNTVAKIRGDIFRGSKIESLIIPSSVKTIEAGAFDNCVELSFVSLGNSLESIGETAFRNCKALTSIDIPNSVKSIDARAFEDCSELATVSLGNSLDSIGVSAFGNCKALTSLEIPNSVRIISARAFEGCDNLTTVTLGESLETIGESAFAGCSKLSSIEIPNSVTTIETGAFYDCYGLASVTLSSSIQTIGSHAFGYIGNSLSNGQQTSVYIPSVDWLFKVQIHSNNNDHLLRNLYVGQQPLISLEIPNEVKDVSILPLLYRCNSKITALHTGDGLRTLPEGRSEYITQVTLGSSVTKVESEFPNAFIVVSNVSKAPTITKNTFPKCDFDNGADGVVVVLGPSEQNTYSKAKIWENMQLTNQSNKVEVNIATPGELDWEILQKSGIPAAKVVGLTVSGEINDKDFVQMKSNMKSLLYLDLTNAKITNIPNNALDSKQQLLSLALPNTVKTIGAYAFRGCSGIKELELPTDLEEIGEEAFTGINIETLDFNYALKKIGNRAFANTPLKEISFQNKVEVIGNEAFRGCNLQQELTFSDALISIGERAFEGHRGITGHLTIPDGVTSVGQSAFAGTSISTVFISGKMTTLESSVFADCDLLDVVYIPDNITRIKSSAFQGCESLKNLRLSQNIEVIEREAFRSIPIKSVNIPESVEKIDGYAFADCANLRFVTLPANIKSLDEGVFSACRQLMNLTVKNITPPTVKANTFRGVNTDKCIISFPTVAYKPYVLAEYWGSFVYMRNDIAVQMKGNGSISFASGDTMEDEEEASSRMMMATRAGEETEGTVTTVEDGSSLYVPQNGLVRFYITPASGEKIVSATFDGVDITAQIVDGIYETTADKDSANLVVSFSEKTKTAQTITWEQEFEPMMVGDKVTLNATASSGLVVTYEFADGESSERAELSDGIITILKSGNIALVAKQSGNEEYASATTDVKYIKAYAYGDANGNMEINSADLAVTVDYAIGNEPQEFFFRAADVNKDKNVNVADVSGVVDIVLSAPAATDNASGNARFATSDNMVSILEGNSLNFYFTNKEEGFLTFQCDIRMAEGSMPELDITGNPIVAIRNKKGTGNHIAVARLLEDGCIRILVYSTDNTPIPSNYSFALSLENEPNESDIEILNAGYSYRDSEQIAYGRLNCGVVTGLDSVMDEADQMDIKVNGNTISFYSATDCLMPIVSVNGISYMLNVKAGFNEFTVNKGVYVIGKNKVIIK